MKMKRRSAYGWIDLLKGILFLGLGITALWYPKFILSSIVIIFGITVLASGVSDIVFYIRLRRDTGHESKAALTVGVVSVLAGVLLLFNLPFGAWILNVIFPIWFIVHCTSRIVNYGFMQRSTGRVLSTIILCLDILGLLFGVLMIFNPLLFTMSLATLVAINLVILGASSVIEALSNMGSKEFEYTKRGT